MELGNVCPDYAKCLMLAVKSVLHYIN